MITLDFTYAHPKWKNEISTVQVAAKNLREALVKAEELTNFRFVPTEYDRHFYLTEDEVKDGQEPAIDIHVMRGDEEICPKHDLGFQLLPGDAVRFCMLIC